MFVMVYICVAIAMEPVQAQNVTSTARERPSSETSVGDAVNDNQQSTTSTTTTGRGLSEEQKTQINRRLTEREIDTGNKKALFSLIFGGIFGGTSTTSNTGSIQNAAIQSGQYMGVVDGPDVIPARDKPYKSTSQCPARIDTALQAFNAQIANKAIYEEAGAREGVNWKWIAAVHYIESGGDFSPEQSLIDGRPLTTSLLDSAVSAARVLKQKLAQSKGANDVERLAGVFARYNGLGNAQCDGSRPKPQSKYTGCPAKFSMEDHLYPMGCFDDDHENMWIIYCYDGQTCAPISEANPTGNLFRNRIGALTLIRELQRLYPARTSSTPGNGLSGPTIAPPSGFLRAPQEAFTIANEMKNRCGAGATGKYYVTSVNSNNVSTCIDPLTSAGERFKAQARISARSNTYLQCVGLAHALASEMSGPLGSHSGNAINQAYTGGNLRLVSPSDRPFAGDMVVFGGQGWSGYGHIAYIANIPFTGSFEVVEAHMNGLGSVSAGTYSTTNSTIRGYLRKN